MTTLENLPLYKQADAIARQRGENVLSMINAYLAGYVAGAGTAGDVLNRTEPVKSESDVPEGYPVPPTHSAYRFERSASTGHVILPEDWDDPEDAIYDGYANK